MKLATLIETARKKAPELVADIEGFRDASLRCISVPGDGDCFFHTVLAIAKDVIQHEGEEDELVRALQAFCVAEPFTVDDLRRAVARRVLNLADAECTDAVRGWIGIFAEAKKENNASIMAEFDHVREVHDDITPADRWVLFRAMCDKNRWWANEFALQTLERAIPLRFVVVDHTMNVMFRERDLAGRSPGRVAIVMLHGQHYEPMRTELSKRLSFQKDGIPLPLFMKINDADPATVRSFMADREIQERVRAAQRIANLISEHHPIS